MPPYEIRRRLELAAPGSPRTRLAEAVQVDGDEIVFVARETVPVGVALEGRLHAQDGQPPLRFTLVVREIAVDPRPGGAADSRYVARHTPWNEHDLKRFEAWLECLASPVSRGSDPDVLSDIETAGPDATQPDPIVGDSAPCADTVPSTSLRLLVPEGPRSGPESESERRPGRRRRGHRSIGKALSERRADGSRATPSRPETAGAPPDLRDEPVSAVLAPGNPPSLLVRFEQAPTLRMWVQARGNRVRLSVASLRGLAVGGNVLVVMQLPDSTFVQFPAAVTAHTRRHTEIESGPLEFRALDPVRAFVGVN